MKEKKESLETNRHLSDAQLENVGGGLTNHYDYYAYCYDCEWRSEIVRGVKVFDLVNGHKTQTGHTNVIPRLP